MCVSYNRENNRTVSTWIQQFLQCELSGDTRYARKGTGVLNLSRILSQSVTFQFLSHAIPFLNLVNTSGGSITSGFLCVCLFNHYILIKTGKYHRKFFFQTSLKIQVGITCLVTLTPNITKSQFCVFTPLS